MTIDRLLVIWGAPSDGGRHVIGHLVRDRSRTVRFWYEADLSAAFRHGFSLLPAFPRHATDETPYEARYLFATFADRIPSPQRSDARAMLASWGVADSDDQFEILAKSGGLRATDRIELAEYRSPDDALDLPLEFRVAGTKYVARESRGQLEQGTRLSFVRERDNPHDVCATIIARSEGGKHVGYVPRQYSGMISKLIDVGAGLVGIAVREMTVPEDAGRWLVRVERVR